MKPSASTRAAGPPAWPERIKDEAELDDLLSRPTDEVVDLFRRTQGDLIVLGAAGKIGPSLVRMACRAGELAGQRRRILAVDRFVDPAGGNAFDRLGAQPIACDLLDADAVERLPEAENVLYLAGAKFGTTDQPAATWACNALVPAYVSRRYRGSRIVAFSTGCVYPMTPATSAGSVETDPLEPLGEYPNSCVARERVFEHFSRAYRTPVALVRLNYAVELRYGVLVDLGREILAGRPVDLTTGHVNVIWQGDVNAAVLRLLEHAAAPPLAINLTGTEKLSVRQLALRLGQLTGKPVRFAGQEAETALLSDASAAAKLLGPPSVPTDRLLQWTADWLARGARLLDKPTHFQTRDGKF